MVSPITHKPSVIGTYKTILDGRAVSYTITRSSRAKYARLEVKVNSGLSVVIPSSYNIDNIPAWLKIKKQWILDKLAEYGRVKPIDVERNLRSGDSIPYLGRNLRVVERHHPGMACGVKLERDRLLVNLDSQNDRLNLVLEWWYRQQAERIIKKRTDTLCPQLGVTYGRLTIRRAKTRWGSCSRKGNLNFNWKLLMVPEPVIDYVIIHELAHLKEMNHSKKFWKLVAQQCSQWRRHRKWLRNHETVLSATLLGTKGTRAISQI